MRDYLRTHEGEARIFIVLAVLMLFLGFASPTFFSAGNFASLMNNNAVNVIWAVGLLVVLVYLLLTLIRNVRGLGRED